MNTHRAHPRRIAVVAAALVAAGLALAPGAATAAAGPAAPAAVPAAMDGQGGWLRLGHLSPDTKAVDVEVAALGGGGVVLELQGVDYGDVSAYSELAAGTYTVSMVPAGSPASTAAVVSSDVKIDADGATTVVAYGPSSDLEVKAVRDDLTEPTAGNARLRLFQASTVTDEVDVATTTGLWIAQGATAGSVTGYAEVPAGPWTLELSGEGATGSTEIDVAAGSVSTLFVLDTAAGGLTILSIVDSAAVGVTPDGGVNTGGGGTAGTADLFRWPNG